MRGGAEIYDDFDNDDDDPMALRNECDQYEENEWDSYMEEIGNSYEESTPVVVNEPSPSSSPSQPSQSPLQKSRQSSPPLRPPSLSPLPKSNIRLDPIPLRLTENPDITMS